MIYCGVLLDTEMLVVWTQSEGRTKHPENSPWELLTLYQASTSPKSGGYYPTGASPKLFRTIISQHAWDRTIVTGQSCQGKFISLSASPGSASVSILVRRCPGGQKEPLAKYESSHPGADIKNVWCFSSEIAYFSLEPKRQNGETRLKEEIFTFGV